jgi:hypothetical protein
MYKSSTEKNFMMLHEQILSKSISNQQKSLSDDSFPVTLKHVFFKYNTVGKRKKKVGLTIHLCRPFISLKQPHQARFLFQKLTVTHMPHTKPKVHYCVYSSPVLVPTHSQINVIHTNAQSITLKSISIVFLYLGPPRSFFPFGFLTF